jgi:hypothetical protein
MNSQESDFQEPPLRLTVEGMRWMGDEFEPVGTSGVVSLYGTDVGGEDASTVLRALRRILAQRLRLLIPVLAVSFGDLDFDAPNAPTEDDVSELLGHAERIVEDLRALRELSPEVIDDDGDDDDDDDDVRPREPDPSRAEAE